ncbi:hypothetical protein AB832_03555 [Flavobacteriaceae bacterium (ex Bugula neritina AB1)]|nr:hypothetical protein AB832_03555 [Flavobacteriaceae bacterium (ex Bugula neritina AB1)]
MKIICKHSPTNKDGSKIFNFTVGKEYEALTYSDGQDYSVYDDNGKNVNFFYLWEIFKTKA